VRKKNHHIRFFSFFIFILISVAAYGNSGGILIPQQAAFDVTYYDLDLTIEPEEKTISGSLLVRAVFLYHYKQN